MVVSEKTKTRSALLAILGSLMVVFTCLPVTPCAAQNEEPQGYYMIMSDPYGFELKWRPRQTNAWGEEVLRELMEGHELPPSGPWVFNWVARRDPCFLVSGDLSRFALARTFRESSLNPKIAKLGDLRIHIKVVGRSYWLDELDGGNARFYPWGTVHHFSPRPEFPLEVEVRATLVKNTAIAIKIELGANSAKPLEGILDLSYGGLALKEPTRLTSYFTIDAQEGETNKVTLKKDGGVITDATIPVQVIARTNPIPRMFLDPSNRLGFQFHFVVKKSKSVFRFMAFQKEVSQGNDFAMEHFDEYVQETRKYYDALLNTVEIQTPDRVLDSGFYAALLNLDYAYQSPAWLEGIHKWNSYYVNNYQISAAIDLGQLDLARRALLFFADRPGGPGQTIEADGTVFKDMVNVQFEGGLPYYILQLYRYWLATGDRKTLDDVWPATKENLERLLKNRDPDRNLLLDWVRGGNMFLYQSDHLSLPGDAFSPTIMVAANLNEMADMAEARGESGDAERWRHRAAYMRSESVRRFWSPKDARFIAGVDSQGLAMQANFYTDFVFPQLYSDLPVDYTWTSLMTLDRTLWVKNRLMRVGNYMPPLFGNNMVMPVQMAEAAEAYFQAGLPSRGWRLLHGVGLAATIITNSPGSFPERMSDTGFGQPQYLFSNSAGSFVRTVVSGLFGLENTASNRPLVWRPSIPEDWSSAKLRVGEISMRVTGAHGQRTYSISLPRPQTLVLRVPLHGHRVEEVKDAAGEDLGFTIIPHPSGDFLEVRLAPKNQFGIQVRSIQGPASAGSPSETSPELVRQGAPRLAGKREPLQIDDRFNSDSILSKNLWRREPVKVELSSCLRNSSKSCELLVGHSSFRVSPNGRNMIMVEVGNLHPYTQELQLSGFPNSFLFHVGKFVRGIEFLVASELSVRLTGVQVGEVELRYSTGAEGKEPLVYGRNIDCFTKPFATETDNYEIDTLNHLSAFVVKTDSSRNLDSIRFYLFAADASVGILGINLVLPE